MPSKIVETCELALLINDEASLGLEVSASIAERIIDEGYTRHPREARKSFWETFDGGFKCAACNAKVRHGYVYCPVCGSHNATDCCW